LEEPALGSTLGVIGGFAVCLGLAWGLLIFGELPGDIASTAFVQTVANTQYVWVAKIWFLTHHVLLDAQLELSMTQLLVLAVVPWFVCGITIGMLSRRASRGFALGFSAMILSIIISWLIIFLTPILGIGLPDDGLVTLFTSNSLQYIMSLLSFQALGVGVVSALGGALGGALTPKRE
jgi:hypothetical protein